MTLGEHVHVDGYALSKNPFQRSIGDEKIYKVENCF